MRLQLQFGGCLLVLGLGAAMAAPSLAQRARKDPPPQHQAPAAQPRRQDRPPQRQHENRPPQPERRQGGGAGNPPRGNAGNAPASAPRPNFNPNRPPSAYTPPPASQKRFSDLSQADKQRVLENNRKFQNLSPAQKRQMQENYDTWNRLTPAQKEHIRNDVLPKWKGMPVERRQAIRQRLQILQNMPESARNQRLNDPNFTRGMSEEDKNTLRDLSHMHVGAPDPPGE